MKPEPYGRVNIQDLILLCIYSVLERGDTCTFENLVAECFSRFPDVFAFKRYPKWPDSLRLDRPLRQLRKKALIVGSVANHFSLTEFGKQKAIETEQILKAQGTLDLNRNRIGSGRSADDKLIAFLKNNTAFERFLQGCKDLAITELEFRALLRCTLETPPRVLKQNLEYCKKLAESYHEEDLIAFLSLCEKRFMKGE